MTCVRNTTVDEIDAISDQFTEALEGSEEGELFQQVGSMPIPFMQSFMNPGGKSGDEAQTDFYYTFRL